MAAGAPVSGPVWLMPYLAVPFADRGRGFDGADCRGLVYLILEHERGVRVPEPEELYAAADARCPDVPGFVADTIAAGWEHCALAAWAVLLFRCAGVPAHVGVSLDGNQFVHTRGGIGVHVSALDGSEPGETSWRKRLIGAYRYVG